MNIFKKGIMDCDKYYYDEFERLFNFKSNFSLKLTLLLIRQYYECEISREKQEKNGYLWNM